MFNFKTEWNVQKLKYSLNYIKHGKIKCQTKVNKEVLDKLYSLITKDTIVFILEMAQVIRISHVLFVDRKQKSWNKCSHAVNLLVKSQLEIARKERFSDCMKFHIKEFRKAWNKY